MMEQGSQEWHEYRRNHIGSSDIGVIIGLSPYKKLHALWLEKIGLSDQGESNSAMKWGTERESIARDLFSMQINVSLEPKVVEHPIHPWMSASLDGYNEKENVLIEIKCLKKEDHEQAKSGKIKPLYLAQMQWQMACTGCEFAYYVGYHEGDLYHVKIDKDDKAIQYMIDEAQIFWECVKSLTPPKENNENISNVKQIEDNQWDIHARRMKFIVQDLQEAKENLARLEMEYEEELRILRQLSQDCSATGSGVTLRQMSRKGTIDYKSIEALKCINLEEYRKPPMTFWKVEIDDTIEI